MRSAAERDLGPQATGPDINHVHDAVVAQHRTLPHPATRSWLNWWLPSRTGCCSASAIVQSGSGANAVAAAKKLTQPGRGQLLAVGSTGAKKANGESHVELAPGIWAPPRLGPWVELSTRRGTLVVGRAWFLSSEESRRVSRVRRPAVCACTSSRDRLGGAGRVGRRCRGRPGRCGEASARRGQSRSGCGVHCAPV